MSDNVIIWREFTVEQVAQAVGLKAGTIKLKCTHGEIRAQKINGEYVISGDEFLRWRASRAALKLKQRMRINPNLSPQDRKRNREKLAEIIAKQTPPIIVERGQTKL